MSQPYLSAVITCLNEENTIERFIESLILALDRTGREYEIILVDDGSKDQTFAAISRLVQVQPRVRVGLDLMKNAGQAAAITAGLGEANGLYLLMMDSDFQLSPDDVGSLIAAAQSGADFVNGYRLHRRDSAGRKLPSWLANWAMRRISGVPLRDFGCTFRLVDQHIIKAFKLGPEKILSIPLLVSRAGRVVEVPVSHAARPEGKSGWTFRKLWRYNADNFVVLSEPVFQFVGLNSLIVAFLVILRVGLDPVLHWSLLGSVSNGLILNAVAATALIVTGLLCVVGELVVRCHRAVLARPAYVIRHRILREDKKAAVS
jgi:undecaprenyl-phosphate 4-deoxy-4-formamido-L-arabinose transferase